MEVAYIAIFISLLGSAFGLVRDYTKEETIIKKLAEHQSDQLKQIAMNQYETDAKLNRHIETTTRIDKDNAVLATSMNGMKETMNKLEETMKEFVVEMRDIAKEIRKK